MTGEAGPACASNRTGILTRRRTGRLRHLSGAKVAQVARPICATTTPLGVWGGAAQGKSRKMERRRSRSKTNDLPFAAIAAPGVVRHPR
jgi:hypothetical protein